MCYTPDVMDNEITKVLFRFDAAEVTAVFPEIDEGNGKVSCYVHMGGHSACTRGWYGTTRPATDAEYAPLKRELESTPYEYKLQVIKRWPRR